MAILFLVLPWLRFGLSLLVMVHQGPQCFFSAWLRFCSLCGVQFSPSILVLGSGDSGSVTLLPTLFSRACVTPTCLGFVQGAVLSCLPCLWAFGSGFIPLPHAEDFVFVGTGYCQTSWWAAGFVFHCHLCWCGCLPFLHPAVRRQVGVAHPFHPSLLLGEVLSRLCSCSWYWPPVVPREGPPLVSASGQVFVSRSSSPFRVSSTPFSRYVKERSVVLFEGGNFCSCSCPTSGWFPPGSRSPQRVHLCHFPP